MSAAVIGRQLRQQNTSSRTSGPLVAPVSVYKGRPRTPSQIGRPYSPAATSSTFGTGTIHTGSTGAGAVSSIPLGVNHYSASTSDQLSKHNAAVANSSYHASKKVIETVDEEPRMRCTCHCFCIALKALSLGLCLLTAGVIMSGFGFYNEHYFLAEHNNLTAISEVEKASLTMYRNLTYAGPVIMGLGGIMVVAALVLTFEVRDTLGVKVAPVKQQKQQQQQPPPQQLNLSSIGQSASSQVPVTSMLTQIPHTGRKNTVTSVSSTVALVPLVHLSTPLQSNSTDPLIPGASDTIAPRHSNTVSQGHRAREETILETTLTETNETQNDAAETTARPSACQVRTNNLLSSTHNQMKSSKNESNYCIFTTSSSSETNSFTNLTIGDNDGCMDYISSPQDTEISDPEACSIVIDTTTAGGDISSSASLASSSPGRRDLTLRATVGKSKSASSGSRWKSGRCSCSASPSNSIDAIDTLDLIFLTNTETKQKIADDLFEEHLLQQRLLLEQQKAQLKLQERLLHEQRYKLFKQPQRTIASIESDGLSSTSTSSENLFTAKRGECRSAPAHTDTHRLRMPPPKGASTSSRVSASVHHHQHHHHQHHETLEQSTDDSPTVPLLTLQCEENKNESGKLFPLLQKQPLRY